MDQQSRHVRQHGSRPDRVISWRPQVEIGLWLGIGLCIQETEQPSQTEQSAERLGRRCWQASENRGGIGLTLFYRCTEWQVWQ